MTSCQYGWRAHEGCARMCLCALLQPPARRYLPEPLCHSAPEVSESLSEGDRLLLPWVVA